MSSVGKKYKAPWIFFASAALITAAAVCTEDSVNNTMKEKENLSALEEWKIHDPDRPLPPVVDPGPYTGPVSSPPDAAVLFDGTDLSEWENSEGGPADWIVKNGYMEVKKKSGSIKTRQKFGDCRLHVEWAAPFPPSGKEQDRGNSGVFLMKKYEIQVLDNYENTTYADGMAGAVYGQYPPLANACRPPGEWQIYDIVFRRPRFGENGEVLKKARFTVFHNGVLIQDCVQPTGPTAWKKRPPYKIHQERLPLSLQDHGSPVRFRNIWIRDLEPENNK